jgi:transposase
MKKSVYASVVGAGIDVHYKFSTVAFVDAAGKVVRRERLEHSDREALRGWISHWPSGMTVVMEASFGWGWLSDLMEEVGLKVRLANCFKVEKMRQARGVAKTNDKDAALLAPLPKEATTWWEVWRAPQEVRNRREWMRHRTDLVGMQTRVKCRIHAIFHRHGIFHEFSDLFGGGGRKFLAALCEGKDPQGERLSSGALEALRSEMVLLLHLRQELARIAAQLRKELDRTPEVRRIMSVPGFGLILAHVLLAEMGDIKRFRRSRSLANYSLLGPKSDDTGEDPPPGQAPLGRHLGQRGNRVLKWAFIEAAHGAVRHGGQCREKFNRATNNGRRDRGRGYIKVGRSLVDVVYAVLRDQRMYQERRPNQPPQSVMNQSDKAKSRVTRPGMGRLYHPMVAAGK